MVPTCLGLMHVTSMPDAMIQGSIAWHYASGTALPCTWPLRPQLPESDAMLTKGGSHKLVPQAHIRPSVEASSQYCCRLPVHWLLLLTPNCIATYWEAWGPYTHHAWLMHPSKQLPCLDCARDADAPPTNHHPGSIAAAKTVMCLFNLCK